MKIDKEKILITLVIVFALIAFFALFPFSTSGAKAQFQNQQAAPAFQVAGASGGGADCGDLNDVKNVQHLSHHPDKYAGCIAKVDDAFFRQAVGQDKSAFIGG